MGFRFGVVLVTDPTGGTADDRAAIASYTTLGDTTQRGRARASASGHATIPVEPESLLFISPSGTDNLAPSRLAPGRGCLLRDFAQYLATTGPSGGANVSNL